MQPLTPAAVQAALLQRGLDIRLQFYDTPTATAQQAADSIGCELGQIVKSLAFMVDGQPVVILAGGDGRVDTRKIAALFGAGRKKVKMADPAACVAIYGYPPGAVPPVGLRTPGLAVVIDERLQRYERVYPAAGAANAVFGITPVRLVVVTGGRFADVRRNE